MTPRDHQVQLSPSELEAVKTYAEQEGVSVEDAASALFSRAFAQRMRKGTGKSPAANIMKFHKIKPPQRRF